MYGLLIGLASLGFAQQQEIHDLFYENVPQIAPIDRGSQTFVIWVNGDAEHFQGETYLGEGPAGSELFRVDAYEVARIKKTATLCNDCNVVLLHDQRGSDYWYTRARPWGVWLTVMAKGKQVIESETWEVDETDPDLLGSLLRYAQFVFPSSTFHLIYRGHPFSPRVKPNPKFDPLVGPPSFDYSHPNSAYGLAEFTKSLKDAGLDRTPLATLTFASCRMATLEAFAAAEPYAEYTIAPPFDFLETLETGFGYAFLRSITPEMTSWTQADQIAYYAMRRFEKTPYLEETLAEYPITVVRNDPKQRPLKRFGQKIEGIWRGLTKEDREDLARQAIVKRTYSTRYEAFKAKTIGSVEAEKLTELFRAPDGGPGTRLDLGHTLKWLRARHREEADFENWMSDNSWFFYGRLDGSISGITVNFAEANDR